MARAKRRTAFEMRDEAKAKLETIIYKKRIDRISGKWDAMENDEKRRKPSVEMGSEESAILKPFDRLKMINLCRDLERNSSSAKSLIKQLKLNVVGNLAKMQLNTEDEAVNKSVNSWFNGYYTSICDSKSDLHWNELLKLVLASVVREGDCLIVFDDIDLDDGKLLTYEADQLVEVNELQWKEQAQWVEEVVVDGKKTTIPMKQSSGVVYDKRGRVQAYIVTQKHGQTSARMEDVTIFARGVAKLIKLPYRLNQLRGTGEFFTAVQDIEDIYEMRMKELQSAKLASTFAGTVSKEDGTEEAVFRGGVNPESILEADDATPASTSEKDSYDNLEALTGGAMEYLLPGEEFKAINFDRPNMDVQHFYDFVLQSAGAGLGMAKTYTKLEAYNSYTAFRGEMLLTWPTFYEWQKFLERHVCDWLAVKAIQWAMDNGKLKVNLPAGWEGMISWVFPTMPQVDPTKDNTARRESMKDGFIDFSQVLGPDWKQKLEATAEGLKYARELGIPLTAFESKSGALIEDTDTKNEIDDNNDDNEEK